MVDGGKAGRESGSGDENHGEYIMVNAKLEPGKLREHQRDQTTGNVPPEVLR